MRLELASATREQQERNDERRQGIMAQISQTVGSISLDKLGTSEKKEFAGKFSELKTYIYQM